MYCARLRKQESCHNLCTQGLSSMKCNIPLFKYLFLLKDSAISTLSLLFSLLGIDDCLCCSCSCAISFYSFTVMFMSSQYLTITSSHSLFLECMYKLGKHLFGCSKPPAYAAVKCKLTLTQKLSQGSTAVSTKLTSSAIYHMLSLFLSQRIVFSSFT